MQLLYRFEKARFYASNKIFLLVLLTALQIDAIAGQRTCYQCEGINCQRTTYTNEEKCSNGLDICATIFDGQTIQAQGCLENLAEDLRMKCNSDDVNSLNECHKCNANLCNTWAANTFQCVQCDSSVDSNCVSNANTLSPSRCPISRTPNEYCYAQKTDSRVVRGCTSTLEQQRSCMLSETCAICQPNELDSCNNMNIEKDINPDPTTTPSPSATTDPGNGSGSAIVFGLTNYIIISVACLYKLY